MPILDYSFLEESDEEQAEQDGLLDYSFLSDTEQEPDEASPYAARPLPEARSIEPTFLDSIQDFFTGGERHRARASNELAARRIAEEQGVEVSEVYEAAGGSRPLLNPEGRAPIRALFEGTEIVADQLASFDVPKGVVNTVARTIRGGDDDVDDDNWLDQVIEGTDVPPDPDADPNYQQFQNLGKNLGYSMTTMASGIAAYAAGSAVSTPLGGTVAAGTASATVAFRGSKDEFLSRAREAMDAYFVEIYDREMTQDEWDQVRNDFNAAANKYGAWEAIPEAVGNLVFIRAFAIPLRGARGPSLAAFKQRAYEVAGRTAQTLATENVTEIATALGQNRAELEVGMTDRELSLAGAIQETVVPTTLLTTIMGGAGVGGRVIGSKFAPKFDQDGGPPDLFNPTHKAGGGQDVQPVTRKGKVVPDTFVNSQGEVIRDSNAVEISPYDASLDVNATVAAVKDELGIKGPVEEIDVLPFADVQEVTEEIDITAPPAIEEIDILPVPDVELDSGPVSGIIKTEMAGPAVAPAAEISLAANEASTSPENALEEPTDAQKEAGNYKKGHTRVQGFDIAIENPAGSKRRPEWPTLKQHYGYIKRTVGADSKPDAAPHEVEQVDVFVKPDADIAAENPIFIIDQATEDGQTFDEHKVMMGFDSEQEAREAYLANYTKGWKGLKAITEATPEEFKTWLDEGSQELEYAPEAIKAEIKKIPDLPIEQLSEQDRTKLHDLKLKLPSAGEERAAAKARLEKKRATKKAEVKKLEPKSKAVKTDTKPVVESETEIEQAQISKKGEILQINKEVAKSSEFSEVPADVVETAIQKYKTKDKALSYLRGRLGRNLDPNIIAKVSEAFPLEAPEAEAPSEEGQLDVETGVPEPDAGSADNQGQSDAYLAMRGKEISYEVEVADTGEVYTVTADAAEVMEKMDTRIDALKQLRDCI